tara:strand:+ start:41 stop:619 length:579 start_codon:yes stop_codon:yes gene_type:complete
MSILNPVEPFPWTYIPNWISIEECSIWYKELINKIRWEQPLVSVYGRSYLVPRKTNFLSEPGITYRYSGLLHYGKEWPDWFKPLLEKVCYKADSNFNGCLLNLYRNGNDRMGLHSDNEKELDSSMPIASLSFGVERDFIFKHKLYDNKVVLKLKSGDLLIMKPQCQNNWLHSLPPRKRVVGSRINLTFRCYQ